VTLAVRTTCRLCSGLLEKCLSLPGTPPANEFTRSRESSAAQDVIPLDVCTCTGCGHVQLSGTVSPDRLFRDYVYVSGTSPSFVAHFRRFASSLFGAGLVDAGDLVVEVGSNDGTLLKELAGLGATVAGVDPAVAIAERATADGVPTYPSFFTPELASAIREERGPARLVVANNVFAHVDDMKGVLDGVLRLLSPDGTFVFEVSYLLDVVHGCLFDTIYHEHLSYHSVDPLLSFLARNDMALFDVERIPTHGGSIRAFACRKGVRSPRQSVHDLRVAEVSSGLLTPGMSRHGRRPWRDWRSVWTGFGGRIASLKQDLTTLLSGFRTRGMRVAGYGAPAKATTLMYTLGLGPDSLEYVVDDSPLKQGLFTPGLGVPVVPSSRLEEDPVDVIVVLAWNFADSIIASRPSHSARGGKWVVPAPSLRIV
jgi:SAM-dependent methyltransferase